MTNGLLLWADDEMELLKPHLLFLEKKGYEVVTVTNGIDAIEECKQRTFDLVLLDEMMPGLTGLETLQRIKELQPTVPVVMVTKSEEEDIMNQAVGRNIADYLIKPVNPNQILLTLKKFIHKRELVAEVTQTAYQQQFQQLSMQMMDCRTWDDWTQMYRQLVRWELQLSATDSAMGDMLRMQKEEANIGFSKFVKHHYMDWLTKRDMMMSLMCSNNRYSLPYQPATKSFSLCSTISAMTNGKPSKQNWQTLRLTNNSIAVSCPQPPNMLAMLFSPA